MTAPLSPPRRRFVHRLTGATALAGLGLFTPARGMAAGAHEAAAPAILSGQVFDLEIVETIVDFTGAKRVATTVNGQLPGPTLHWKEGERVTIRVTNRLKEDTAIHWHGILLPSNMDGVPGLSFDGIKPGEMFTYQFDVVQSGTYWYHSHGGFQEQTGVYGAIVVTPREADPIAADRDHTLLLSDWSDESPDRIFRTLMATPDYYSTTQPTFAGLVQQARETSWSQALDDRAMWMRMRMSPTDLADVTGATYTYLSNGHTPDGNWTATFSRGERVRLRLINGSAMTYFDVRIPGLTLTVVAADGLPVQPVTVDELRIGVAETYDVIVTPQDDQAYTIFAQSIDRSGYARATLAPRAGMTAAVPAMDKFQSLTMKDMGMSHGMAGMHSEMNGMQSDATTERSTAAAGAAGHAMQGMSHGEGGTAPSGPAPIGGIVQVTHRQAEQSGPGNSMIADNVSTSLDDPGPGLRGSTRNVLTYAMLRALHPPPDERPPTREIELHLTGNMDRYMWSFNGKRYTDAQPIVLKHGERVRFVLINDTMMMHPIHLHGLWSDLESPDGAFQVRKHTLSVNPAQRITYRVSADARGHWAYHCHLLYHMEAGMFRAVVVA